MNCSEVQELLSAYYDGELDNAQTYAISAYVEMCEVCKAELDSLRCSRRILNLSAVPYLPSRFKIKSRNEWMSRMSSKGQGQASIVDLDVIPASF